MDAAGLSDKRDDGAVSRCLFHLFCVLTHLKEMEILLLMCCGENNLHKEIPFFFRSGSGYYVRGFSLFTKIMYQQFTLYVDVCQSNTYVRTCA